MAFKNKASDDDRARRHRGAAEASWSSIDGWIDEGMLGGEQPERRGPADRQHDPPADEHRRHAPADRRTPGRPLTRYFPPIVGEVEAGVLPAEWLPAPTGV